MQAQPGGLCHRRRAHAQAIGEPQTIDTRNDPRLSRIFANKVIKIYPAFAEFYGMEDSIEQVVSYFRHAAQGLEEEADPLSAGPGGRRQELDRRAPQAADAGGAFLRDQGFAGERVAARPVRRRWGRPILEGIRHPRRYLNRILSPWAVKRLRSSAATSAKFKVVKRPVDPQAGRHLARPNRATRTTRTSARWSARSTSASWRPMPRTIPDAYSFSGGLCLANQGLLEFVEMFRRRSRCCTRC